MRRRRGEERRGDAYLNGCRVVAVFASLSLSSSVTSRQNERTSDRVRRSEGHRLVHVSASPLHPLPLSLSLSLSRRMTAPMGGLLHNNASDNETSKRFRECIAYNAAKCPCLELFEPFIVGDVAQKEERTELEGGERDSLTRWKPGTIDRSPKECI